MKNISILGSTGSIGTQALDIIRSQKRFKVTSLACHSQYIRLIEQAIEFKPDQVVIFDPKYYQEVKSALADYDIEVLTGIEGLNEIVSNSKVHMVLTAMVGNIGLEPTIKAIQAKKDIALANKETLVTSGHIIMKMAKEKGVKIIPVDSEHSAIAQCLKGEKMNAVNKLILTASGGAFRDFSTQEIAEKKAVDALKHPNWSMGKKITIDSATMMNKGLEVIEAHWLFGQSADQIDVCVHRESVIHSMVEFVDGSIMAQLGPTDMRGPIIYALDDEVRFSNDMKKVNLFEMGKLTFEKPNFQKFPCLDLAYQALHQGGIMPTVLNASNEVLVEAYLQDKIAFYDINHYIEKAMAVTKNIAYPSIQDILEVDSHSRQICSNWIKR